MTCVIGLRTSNTVYMGADSAGVSGTSLSLRADRKVFVRDKFIMGFTSSFRMGELLQYKLKIPEIGARKTLYEYMVTDFVDAVRDCLKAGGYARKENEEESAGTFLVGYQGRLFKIDSDYQVEESLVCYSAIGCGAEIALGAMYSHTEHDIGHPRERIEKALMAAECFSSGVRRPFHVLEVGLEG